MGEKSIDRGGRQHLHTQQRCLGAQPCDTLTSRPPARCGVRLRDLMPPPAAPLCYSGLGPPPCGAAPHVGEMDSRQRRTADRHGQQTGPKVTPPCPGRPEAAGGVHAGKPQGSAPAASAGQPRGSGGSGLRLDREAGPGRRPQVAGLLAGAPGASRVPCRDAHPRDRSGCAVPGSWCPPLPSQTPGRKSWGHRGVLAGPYPGPQATLDGHCPPPAPSPALLRTPGGRARSTPHAPRSCVGWGPRHAGRGGMDQGRGGGAGCWGAGPPSSRWKRLPLAWH